MLVVPGSRSMWTTDHFRVTFLPDDETIATVLGRIETLLSDSPYSGSRCTVTRSSSANERSPSGEGLTHDRRRQPLAIVRVGELGGQGASVVDVGRASECIAALSVEEPQRVLGERVTQ